MPLPGPTTPGFAPYPPPAPAQPVIPGSAQWIQLHQPAQGSNQPNLPPYGSAQWAQLTTPIGKFPAPAPQAVAPAAAPAAPALAEGPYGNHQGADGKWYDAWGNEIAHMNVTPGAGGPGTPPEFAGTLIQPPAAPPVAPPGVTPPGPVQPTTFYSPYTPTPYLQLPPQFLSYLDNNTRLQLGSALQGMGFTGMGQIGQYGEGTWARPTNFDANELTNLSVDPSIRAWLRFFLGLNGYGQSYQIPANYSGTGLPPAPPVPGQPAPMGALGHVQPPTFGQHIRF